MNEEQLRAQLAAVYASTSWRITAPLRLSMTMIYQFKAFVRNPRPAAYSLLRLVGQSPAIRKRGGKMLRSFPGLHQRVQRIVFAQAPNPSQYAAIASPAPAPAPEALNAAPVYAAPEVYATPEPLVDAAPLISEAMIDFSPAPVSANDASIFAKPDLQPESPPAPPAIELTLGFGARAVLAELRAAQRRFH